jgi:hypothetical protein
MMHNTQPAEKSQSQSSWGPVVKLAQAGIELKLKVVIAIVGCYQQGPF